MYTYTYQGCTRNGTESARGHDFGTERPPQDRNGEHSEPDQTRPDRPWRETERTGFMRKGNISGLDRTGPDRPGPDRTGPDWTGPDSTKLDRTRPDQSGPNRPDRPLFGGEWTGSM